MMNSCLLCCPKTSPFCKNCLKVVAVEYGIVEEAQVESCMECQNEIKIVELTCKICDDEFSSHSCHENEKHCPKCKSRGFRFLCKFLLFILILI
jgi:hypothetical protein